MEFLHQKNDASKPVDSVRVNWFYRPRDIGRKSHDTRVVYATMHSDINPLTALRGKCQVRHRSEIDNMEQFRRTPDSFWFEKLYDRYIQKNYDLIPTSTIVNVPEKVKKVLDERWKFVLVEQGRGKELTSASKSCKRCSGYCARYVVLGSVIFFFLHSLLFLPPLVALPTRCSEWLLVADPSFVILFWLPWHNWGRGSGDRLCTLMPHSSHQVNLIEQLELMGEMRR